ncbi:hypothetical protein [Propionispora sp. 2/2-37]|nr:hypothetical protein [Propionispora sp. 2/2-37]
MTELIITLPTLRQDDKLQGQTTLEAKEPSLKDCFAYSVQPG